MAISRNIEHDLEVIRRRLGRIYLRVISLEARIRKLEKEIERNSEEIAYLEDAAAKGGLFKPYADKVREAKTC